MFTETERQTLDPDGLFRKFYDEHVLDGMIGVPSVSGRCHQTDARALTFLVCDLAAVCLLFGDTENAAAVFLAGRERFQGVGIYGERNAFGEIGCVCDYAGSFEYDAAKFGLADVSKACLYILCPSFSTQNPVRVTGHHEPTQVSTPEEAVRQVRKHLEEIKKYRLAKYLDE